MTTYDKFKKLDIDFSLIGLEQRRGDGRYFCTPKGAKIIGNEGVDGIHYCFVKGFDETVFAVNPSNSAGNCVHPLAHSFEDFLRLILTCGGTAAVEQAWMWGKSEFEDFIKENLPLPEQQEVFDVLREKLTITPMESPYEYIHDLQAGFDYGQIPYTKEYGKLLTEVSAPKPPKEWKVFFAEPFCFGSGRSKAVREISVNTDFFWYGRIWHVPTVYVCGKGLIADICVEVDPSAIADYESGITVENPMATNFEVKLNANGKSLHSQAVNYAYWIPDNANQDWASEYIIEHYGLDMQKGWIFMRCSFPMARADKHEFKALSLSLKAMPVSVIGTCFTVSGKGDAVPFTNPVTGMAHTLRVVECDEQEIFIKGHPTYYTEMSYITEPELPSNSFDVQDCSGGDRIIKTADSSDFVGITTAVIGGADGPTVMTVSGKNSAHAQTVCSSLYHAAKKSVAWRMTFYKVEAEDIEVELAARG